MPEDEVRRVLAATDVDDLSQLSTDEVRAFRADCERVEGKVSYLRRMVHGKIDVLVRGLRHHGPDADLSSLIDELSEILHDDAQAGGHTRMVRNLAPADVDQLTAELDSLDPQSLGSAPDAPAAEVQALAERLKAAERALSEQRNSLFGRIDELSGEITRRYKAGEADPESVLPLG